MVLYVRKWDVHPDKVDAYFKWVEGAIKRTLALPGLVEFRAYRPLTGVHQVVVTYEFADLAAFTAFCEHEEFHKLTAEVRALTLNLTSELWGGSPVIPAPLRPVT